MNLYTGNKIFTTLLSFQSPITPSTLFAFWGHWADVFTEVFPVTPSLSPFVSATLAWVIKAGLQFGTVNGYLVFFS